MIGSNAEPGLIVDEEVEDQPGLIDSGDSDDPAEPTGEEPTAADAEDLDPLLDADSDLDEDDRLPNELATAAPAAAATPAVEKKAPAKPAPFTYKGDKGEHTLAGAQHYAGDGLYIPESAIPNLKQALAAAAVHNGSWQREKREMTRSIEQARTGLTEKDVQADALMDLVFKDLATLDSDESVYEWAVNFRQNLPDYRNTIRERKLEHREKQLEARSRPSPEEQEETHSTTASGELERTLDEIFRMPAMKVLDDEDRKELRARFTPRARQLLTISQRDDPRYGLKKGDYIFDGAALLDQITTAAAIKTRTVVSSKAAAQAAEANRRKLGVSRPGARVAAPAASSGTSTAAQPREKGTGRFKSREEYDEWMRSDRE
ncbi:MAG: hypothetical protein M3P26_05365 [Gemmatimonadota bacterium]|nr:hypothetical protein [Gemmatimonadota bacterium]